MLTGYYDFYRVSLPTEMSITAIDIHDYAIFYMGSRWSLNKWVLSLLQKMESDSAVLTLVGSSFHHWGNKTEKSCDFAERVLVALSDGGTSQPADVDEQSALTGGVWSKQCLEGDECSSIDGLKGQHHCLESDAGIPSSYILRGKTRSC